MRMTNLPRTVGPPSAVFLLVETANPSVLRRRPPTTECPISTSSWCRCFCPRGTERTIFDPLRQRFVYHRLTLAHPVHYSAYSQTQPATTSSLLILDDADDDDDYLSCYEVLLPTPSPPSSPHRTQFFPAGSAEAEIPASAVVKSCEDWLAGVKSGMPEIVIIEVCRTAATTHTFKLLLIHPPSHIVTGGRIVDRRSSSWFDPRRRQHGRRLCFPRPMGPHFRLRFLRGDPILDTHEHRPAARRGSRRGRLCGFICLDACPLARFPPHASSSASVSFSFNLESHANGVRDFYVHQRSPSHTHTRNAPAVDYPRDVPRCLGCRARLFGGAPARRGEVLQ